MARDVFISYRNEDKEAANRICAALERENISCWIAPRDIGIGQEWATAIVEGLQRSKSFVLVLSSNSKNARQISREAELADQHGLPIITFRIEDVQPPSGLMYFLGNIQWLDAFGGEFDHAIARLAEVVRRSGQYPSEKTAIRPAMADLNSQAETAHEAVLNPTTGAASPTTPRESVPVSSPTAPFNAPRPAPRMQPAAPDVKSSNSARWMGIAAAAVVVLGLLGWLVFRHPHSQPSPQPPAQDGRASTPMEAAEKFVKERNAGKFAAAWSETISGFNDGVTEQDWVASAEKSVRRNGKVQHTAGGCHPEPDGSIYSCEFTVFYENGRLVDDSIKVKKRDDGSWGVWHSHVQARQ